jgi:hypothetical protein
MSDDEDFYLASLFDDAVIISPPTTCQPPKRMLLIRDTKYIFCVALLLNSLNNLLDLISSFFFLP